MEKESNQKTPPKIKGEVFIKKERCKGCGFCVKFCPSGVLAFSKEYNEKGYHFPEAVNPDACIGCNLCGLYCPDFAIFSVREKKSK